jgi:uncharacterized protein
MTLSERVMLDTNILVYAYYRKSPHHAAARALLEQALEGTALLCVSPQVLTEFYAVVTHPRRISEPLSPEVAFDTITKTQALPGMMTLPVPLQIVEIWGELVQRHAVIGQKVYDVQLVATMLGHGITRLYTYNRKDFTPFPVTSLLPPSPSA